MNPNLLKLLTNKILISFCLMTFFLISCTSTQQEKKQPAKSISYEIESNNLKALTLPTSDFKNVNDLKEFIWTPFILPIQNLTITNAALYIGHRQNNNTADMSKNESRFTPPPQEGGCEILASKTILTPNEEISNNETKSQNQKIQYQFINNTKQKRPNTSLFFILNNMKQPIAVARLNSKGMSQCLLDEARYTISMGFGQQRREVKIDGKSKRVYLDFPKISSIRIDPNNQSNNIKNGDLIRIGRKINLKFTKNNAEFLPTSIRLKIRPDLYQKSDIMSRDLAVDEYLKTSFLVGSKQYQIELESGNYVVAILRKNKLICLNTFNLKSNSSFTLSCSESKIQKLRNDIAYEFENDRTIFDVGFRPMSLIKNKDFVSWTVDTPGAVLLGTPILDKVDTPLNLSVFNENDFFSIVFKNKASFSQVNYHTSISDSINRFKIPLVGMSAQNLIEGQVPFSEYIHVSTQKYSTPDFLNSTNVIHTNGAEISILEPVMTNSGVLFGTNSQDFLIRIIVPRWNTTNILEMYINNQLFRRWVLNRGDYSQPYVTTEKVTVNETKNFTVKFIATGDSHLSNFLTGRDLFLPFAETREMCLSIDEKEKCL